MPAETTAAGVEIGCLVEIDVGAGRCGVRPGAEATVLAGRIAQARGLRFAGLQAYQGSAQHKLEYETRKGLIDQAIANSKCQCHKLVAWRSRVAVTSQGVVLVGGEGHPRRAPEGGGCVGDGQAGHCRF